MEPHKSKTGALDFFLHLGAIVSLYAIVGFLLNLLFTVINVAYPPVASYYFVPNISFPVAALIVLLPVFLILSKLTYKSYDLNPEKKQLAIRKWLTYLTLFITGAVIVADLITVIFYFLDGRDFTISFVLKAVSIFVVISGVFGYYINDLRETADVSKRKVWAVASSLFVVFAIILGFSVIGSPQKQRLIRFDQQKISDLQNIQSQIVSFWQTKKALPVSLDDLKDSLSYFDIPIDPQTGEVYFYKITSGNSFEICANFNLKSSAQLDSGIARPVKINQENENWTHESGTACFSRVVDPDRYPFFSR